MGNEIKRMNYYNTLFLRDSEFKMEQNYHIRVRRLHNRHFFSPGIVKGLEVLPYGTSPAHEVLVTAGMALNRIIVKDEATGFEEEISQEIILTEDFRIDLQEYSNTDVYIYISYNEAAEDQNEDGQQKIHWVERPLISQSKNKPSDPGTVTLILAMVHVKPDHTIGEINYEVGKISLRVYAGFSGKKASLESLTLAREGIIATPAVIDSIASGGCNGLHITVSKVKLVPATGSPADNRLEVTGNCKVDGELTATTLVGDGSKLTNVNASNAFWVKGANGIYFDGNVGIGIDPNTAPLGIRTDNRLEVSGNCKVKGELTATAYIGDGSKLTNVNALNSFWVKGANGIRFDGSVGIGIDPKAPLQIAGGIWDLANSEGDFKIGDDSHRLKIGIAIAGGGAGDARVRVQGGTNRLILGSGITDVLTIQDGKVGIGTITPTDALDIEGDLRINDKEVVLRGGSDRNHGLGWYGAGKLFASNNIDGPVLYGYSGGALGTTNGGQKATLMWNAAGRVGIGTNNPTVPLEVNGNIKATKFIGDGSQLTGIASTSQWTTITAGICYSNGHIGVGTNNPIFRFHQIGGDHVVEDAPISLRRAGAHRWIFDEAAGTGLKIVQMFNDSDVMVNKTRLQINDNGNVAVVGNLDISGNMGINNPTPSFRFHQVGGDHVIEDANISLRRAGKHRWRFEETAGDGLKISQVYNDANELKNVNRLYFKDNGENTVNGNTGVVGNLGIQGNLVITGNAFKPGGGSWSTTSDKKLKKNIQPLKDSLDKLLQLRGISYEWKEPEKFGNLIGTQSGLIAQEVEGVFPEWVGEDPLGNKSLTIRGFEALIIEAVRELNQKIEELKARLK